MPYHFPFFNGIFIKYDVDFAKQLVFPAQLCYDEKE